MNQFQWKVCSALQGFVLDANILIRAVLGKRVRQMIEKYAEQRVRFFAPDVAFADAEKYLPPLLKKRGKPHKISGALRYFREVIELVAPEIYTAFENEAGSAYEDETRMTGPCWHRRSP